MQAISISWNQISRVFQKMLPSQLTRATVCLAVAFLVASSSAFQTRQFTMKNNVSLPTNPCVSCRPNSCFTSRSTRIQMTNEYDGNDPSSEPKNTIISAELNAKAALQAEVAEAVGTAEYEAADVTTVVAPTSNVGMGGAVSDEARQLLALEMNGVGPDGIPESPMMTYEKYLTMQEKRVKVTIRYSANAGLRPFYLTVANQIKSTHPDVLLEKRILPPIGSDAGGDGAIFEVVVDGKTVIGKKKTKLLKVRSSSSSRSSSGDDSKDEGKSDGGSNGGKGGNGEVNPPDIAGGRSIFVSMEKLDQELSKARKKRRPNTAYERKSDAVRVLRGVASGVAGSVNSSSFGDNLIGESSVSALESSGMSDAVMRLERLKAISNSRKR